MTSEVDRLHSRAIYLIDQFEQGGDGHLIDEAILLGREALFLCPSGHPDRSMSLNNLGAGLCARYDRFGAQEDLEDAIVLGREALLLCPSVHPGRSARLNNLGKCLSTRYDRFGAREDLEEGIALGREALMLCPSGHPDRSMRLNNLAKRLSTRYDRFGAPEDLEEGIALSREALLLCPSGYPERSFCLNNLGNRLSTRYDRFGALEDLEEGIALGRESLLLYPSGHPDRSICLSNLGVDLSTRYNRCGAQEDLEDAIALDREALLLCPSGHPERSISLNNLGRNLSTRFHRFGALEDLEEAIVLGREALLLCPSGHPDRSMRLNNLGNFLSIRYDELGALEDLDEAIVLNREALFLCPSGHPGRSMHLNNLGKCLSTRHNQFNALEDLEEAIALDREALLLCPSGHPDRPMRLINLGVDISTRYDRSDRQEDLEDAIALGREALLLCPLGHPDLSRTLQFLADEYHTRYSKLHDANDRETLFSLYGQFANMPHITELSDLSAVKQWIVVAEDFQHPSALLAYQTALRLLVHHLATLPPLPQHLFTVGNLASSLAVDAFSACLRNQSPTKATELLEHGRGVFWNQLTRLNSSLDDVIAAGPAGRAFADEFTRITSLIRNATNLPEEDQHNQLCSLISQLQGVVTEIRQLPGLSRFLLPPLFSEIRQAASCGPVIIVNSSQYTCDALIVVDSRDPVRVPLCAVTKEDIQGMSSKLRDLTLRSKREDVTMELRIFLRKLWDNVVSPIVDVLQTMRPLKTRIWWCPTAEFTLLPLHAANPFRKGQRGLSDLYISSYTPTLNALIRARRHDVSDAQRSRKGIVAIGQANAPGQGELHTVGAELASLGGLIGDLATFTRIEGPESSLSRVVEALTQNEWAHFACHGVLNRRQPFNSAFALQDGRLTIERIIRCKLDNPEFAYLSACHTTVGDEDNLDEVIHLAAAVQFVGFRSVIGTMWAVDDGETNKITSTFYKHMLDNSGRLDYTRAAFALNRAMKELKDIPFDQRILYIHLGA